MSVFYFRAVSEDDLWPVGDGVKVIRFRMTVGGSWELYFKSAVKGIKTIRESLDSHEKIVIRRMSLKAMRAHFIETAALIDLDLSVGDDGLGDLVKITRRAQTILAYSGDGRILYQVNKR